MTKQSEILSKYIEALTTGMEDKQAQLFANSWAEACEPHLESATKQDLENMMVKMEAKFTILYVLGGAIFLAACLPGIQKLLGG